MATTNEGPKISNKEVTVGNVTANSVQLLWTKATDKETPQNKIRYSVTWCKPPYTWDDRRKSSGRIVDISSYTITGLEANTSYEIIIYVCDEVGCESTYNRITVKTALASTSTSRPQTVTRPSSDSTSTSTSTAASSDAQRRKSINTGLSGIPYFPNLLINGNLYNDSESYPAVIETSTKDAAFMLEVKQQQFSNKEIYVRGSGYENVYPGAIVFVDEAITAGSPRPVGNLKRDKIKIFGDFLAGSTTTQDGVSPTNSVVRAASDNIMRTLLSDPRYEPPGRQQVNTEIFTSMKKLQMAFKVDASFAGISMNLSAKTSSSEQKFIQATTLDQDYFTIKLDNGWKDDPSSLFANDISWNEISAQLKGKAIAIVTSVTYGRTFSYMKEYSAKEFTYDGNQKVKGYGQSAESSQSLAESSTYSKDDIFNLGGTALTIAALRSKKTQEELEKAMADNMKFSASNQGVVTKYTVQLITGSSPGDVIKPLYNGKYNEISYTRCPNKVEMHIGLKNVTIGAGNVKIQLDIEAFNVQNGKAVIFKKVDGNSSKSAQDAWWYTFSSSRDREYGDLKKGEYISPNPKLRIRSKDSKIDSYRSDDERRIDISSGKITVELTGSVFAGKNVKIKEVKAR